MSPDSASAAALRGALWIGFFAAVLAAWWILYGMTGQMGLDLLGRPAAAGMQAIPMDRFGPLFAMWAVMMAAMMLPTMAPALRIYEDLIVSADGSRGGWLGLLAGYAAVWVAFAAAIAAAQLALLSAGLVDMAGLASYHALSAGLLVVVGAYQFTRVKEICHGACHDPMAWFLGRWRPGAAGGARMGAGLGAYCVGCCWGIMALGFAGGVMNMLWMGLATLFMVLEKLPQIGHRLTRPAGGLLIAGGLAVLAWPLVAGG